MKFICRLIGMLVVLLILLSAVLCYLDSKDLLTGKLDRLVSTLRILGREAWSEIRLFMGESGIAEDAASILDQGAEYFRGTVSPHATERPGSNAFPDGYQPQAGNGITATYNQSTVSTASPTPVTTATPAPYITIGTPGIG